MAELPVGGVAAVGWCFKPSQPVRLYRGDFKVEMPRVRVSRRVVVVGRCGGVAVVGAAAEWSWSTDMAWVQWVLVGIEQKSRGQQVWRGCSEPLVGIEQNGCGQQVWRGCSEPLVGIEQNGCGQQVWRGPCSGR